LGARALLDSLDPFFMDLREGRFLVQIPGDGTLRIGLHRPPDPGKRSGYGENAKGMQYTDDRKVRMEEANHEGTKPQRGYSGEAGGGVSSLGAAVLPPAVALNGSDIPSTPALCLTVDWARLAAHLEGLIEEAEAMDEGEARDKEQVRGEAETREEAGLRVDGARMTVGGTEAGSDVGADGKDSASGAVRPGVLLFRDLASALAPAGTARFAIVTRPEEGPVWVLRVPLAGEVGR
jgi:hypothetical protein